MPTPISADEELLQAARQVVAGITANPSLWTNPPIPVAQQTAEATNYQTAMQEQVTKKAAAEQATDLKNDRRAVVKNNLSRLKSWAESIVGKNDARLNELGFSGPAAPSPLELPGQPGTLDACGESPLGEVTLTWEKPTDGGKVAGYQIQRKLTADPTFTIVATATSKMVKKTLTGQPPNVTLQYRLVAFNDAGDSVPSNTVEVKL